MIARHPGVPTRPRGTGAPGRSDYSRGSGIPAGTTGSPSASAGATRTAARSSPDDRTGHGRAVQAAGSHDTPCACRPIERQTPSCSCRMLVKRRRERAPSEGSVTVSFPCDDDVAVAVHLLDLRLVRQVADPTAGQLTGRPPPTRHCEAPQGPRQSGRTWRTPAHERSYDTPPDCFVPFASLRLLAMTRPAAPSGRRAQPSPRPAVAAPSRRRAE